MTEEQEARWGAELVAWLTAELDKVIKQRDEHGELVYDYSSDVRMAELRVGSDLTEYARQEEAGCCGSVDWAVTYTDGRVFLIGFTYGH